MAFSVSSERHGQSGVNEIAGQLWTPSLVSRTSPRRRELVVVHPSAEMFPEAYGKRARNIYLDFISLFCYVLKLP